MAYPLNTPEKLKERVIVDTNGCWIWQGHVGKNGYGQVRYQNKHTHAHRAFYLIYRGDVPEGMELDHLCRLKSCVNPKHLEAVPHQVNAKRGHERKPYNRKGQPHKGKRN